MKVRSVGALAALGMLLTSFSVWSFTGDRGADTSRARGGDGAAPASRPADEQDARPASFGAGSLLAEARLGHQRLSALGEAETYVLVDVRADERASGRRAKRHLSIVLDRSGSMQGKRLRNALAAASGAVERLADGDFVSIVDYSGDASVLVPPTELTSSSRARIRSELARVVAAGDTCISCALERATTLVGRQPGAVDRMLLVSDGEATAGVRDMEGMRRVAERVRATGATVTTIGVDLEYNERMLAAIAAEANGRHYFVENPEGLATIFDRELSGLERSVARETRLELELASGVELVEVLGRSFRQDGGRVSVALGSFSAGEERSVLARVRLPQAGSGERAVVTARLAYEDLATGRGSSAEQRLAIVRTADGSRSELDPIVEERVQRNTTVTALTEANRLFAAGDASLAQARVEQKLDEVRLRRKAAVAAAPAPKRAAVESDFARQEAALGAAATAFAEPPVPASAPLEAQSKPKAAIKRNQAEAADLAF